MDKTGIRIARRVVAYMLSVAEQQVDLAFFQGLGMGLAICFEEITGSSAGNKKPQELMQWAMNLPDEKYPRVTN